MGSQVKCALTPLDMENLAPLLMASCGVSILCFESDALSVRPRPHLHLEPQGDETLAVVLVRAADIPQVVLRKVQGRDTWFVDTLCSPVVEFTRSQLTSNVIRAGRLHFDPEFFNERGSWERKPNEFVLWAQKVLRTVKRYCELSSETDLYWGPHAKRLYAAGKLQLLR